MPRRNALTPEALQMMDTISANVANKLYKVRLDRQEARHRPAVLGHEEALALGLDLGQHLRKALIGLARRDAGQLVHRLPFPRRMYYFM